MPPKFEVEIRLPDNEIHIVTVEVEKATRPKPYLGGYRNNRTNLVYHHAFAQTDQIATYHPEKFEREVQTYQYNTRGNRESSVNLSRIDDEARVRNSNGEARHLPRQSSRQAG